MPFTFSHPAIILPATYLPPKWFSLTGLIIGSLTPDFEYFIRMKLESNYSHTMAGLFWFDLPMGVLLAFIFHNIVCDTLYNNLPVILSKRLLDFSHLNWNNYFKLNWLVVLLSILLGAASHLFWDSFTHENGYFVKILPVLTANVEVFGNQIAVFKILQHLSTLVGGFIIVLAILKLPVNKNIATKVNVKYWLLAGSLTIIIVSTRLLFIQDYKIYRNLIVIIISATMLSIILTSFLISNKNLPDRLTD